MNSTALRAAAASWLRYEKKCPLITFERGIGMGNPDVLGINPSRFLIEVEVKVSLSDFKADAKKAKWAATDRMAARGTAPHGTPKYFYYMVPLELVDSVLPFVRPGAGLLTCTGYHSNTGYPIIRSKVDAKAEKLAKRVSIKDCLKLVKHQSGTLCSLANAQANLYTELQDREMS
jgi:hypothetical protein